MSFIQFPCGMAAYREYFRSHRDVISTIELIRKSQVYAIEVARGAYSIYAIVAVECHVDRSPL